MFSTIHEEEIKITELADGMRWVHEQSDRGLCYLAVLIKAGSRHETAQEFGIAHFLEHMLFKGTKKRSSLQLIDEVEGMGAEMNAYTTRDHICLHITFHEDYTARIFELVSDVLMNCTFPEKEIKKERKVILDELQYYKDMPEENIQDEFHELLFKGHPLAHNIIGTRKVLNSLSRKDFLRFSRRHITADKVVISTLMPVKVKKVKKLIETYFSFPEGKEEKQNIPLYQYRPFDKSIDKEETQSYVVCCSPAPGREDKQRIPYLFMNNILGGSGMNSKLNLSLREGKGLVYHIESQYQPYEDVGSFSMYFFCSPSEVTRCITLAEKEIAALQSKKIDEKLLEHYKVQFIGQLLIADENKMTRCISGGRALLQYHNWISTKKVVKKIADITSKELQSLASTFFQPSLSRLIYKGGK